MREKASALQDGPEERNAARDVTIRYGIIIESVSLYSSTDFIGN